MRAAPREEAAVAAAATKHGFRWGLISAGVLGFCLPLMAAVLPEDRADALFHAYSGGGLDVNGPSILARKQLGKWASVFGNYYVDSISSATIDVETYASPYTEHREEKTLGGDFLHDKTTFNLSFTNSEESDFSADTLNVGISQSVFGDLTTVSLGYGRGWNTVRRNIGGSPDPLFGEKKAYRQNFRLGLSQVLTKNLLMSLNYELITDEGYLSNPYHSVRFLDSGSVKTQPEDHPNTHTSHAVGLKALYYLPYRAALHGELRGYTDTWGVNGGMFEIGYTHPWRERWIFDAGYRYYGQTAADFYSDLYPYANAQNYLSRDKELSTFNSQTLELAASYEFARQGWWFIDKGSLNLAWNHIMFDYKDFRDARVDTVPPGTEPLYGFSADVFRLFVSVWY